MNKKDDPTKGWWAYDDEGGYILHFPDASSAEEAAEQYAADGDYLTDPSTTAWVDVYTYRVDENGNEVDGSWHTITIHPPEPECPESESGEHDWQTPPWVWGCDEAPGVWAHGGGVVIYSCCSLCGMYRTKDTWAERPVGRQGYTSITYRPADEKSLRWIKEEELNDDDLVPRCPDC